MFEWYRIVEYAGVALGAALLYALCAGRSLGALQQAGYNGKKYAAWVRRKGNMVRSRNTLLAFLIALSMLVLGVCFSFAGRWAAYIALAPILLFTVIFCIADRRALKVPLVRTARAARIQVLDALVLFVCAAALAVGANALWIEVWPQVELVEHLRYLPLAALPLLFPELLRLANLLERPFSAAKNRRYLAAAKKQLLTAPCVKIAVTGSCGKTSVKNFLAGILGERWRVFATPASYNTPLGIAKAIEGVDLSQYDFFIAEMGARHKGDIAELCELVRPDHCIVTGICPQHLETFGTVEGIVAAKGEILRGTKRGGFAVIGQDEYTDRLDPAAAGLKKVAVGEHGEFGAFGVVCSPEGIDFDLALGTSPSSTSCPTACSPSTRAGWSSSTTPTTPTCAGRLPRSTCCACTAGASSSSPPASSSWACSRRAKTPPSAKRWSGWTASCWSAPPSSPPCAAATSRRAASRGASPSTRRSTPPKRRSPPSSCPAIPSSSSTTCPTSICEQVRAPPCVQVRARAYAQACALRAAMCAGVQVWGRIAARPPRF